LLRSQSGDLGKTGGIRDGEISQDFSVKTNACDFKPTHEFAVGQFIHARRRIYPNDPQSPEVSFADTTIAIGIHERPIDRIRRCAEQLAMASTKPLGQIQYFFSPSVGFEPSFDTHGIFSLSLIPARSKPELSQRERIRQTCEFQLYSNIFPSH